MEECRKQIESISEMLKETTSMTNSVNITQEKTYSKSMTPEDYNKMIDNSVVEHGKMMKNATYMSPDERNEEHAKYTENAEKAKKDYLEEYNWHHRG